MCQSSLHQYHGPSCLIFSQHQDWMWGTVELKWKGQAGSAQLVTGWRTNFSCPSYIFCTITHLGLRWTVWSACSEKRIKASDSSCCHPWASPLSPELPWCFTPPVAWKSEPVQIPPLSVPADGDSRSSLSTLYSAVQLHLQSFETLCWSDSGAQRLAGPVCPQAVLKKLRVNLLYNRHWVKESRNPGSPEYGDGQLICLREGLSLRRKGRSRG